MLESISYGVVRAAVIQHLWGGEEGRAREGRGGGSKGKGKRGSGEEGREGNEGRRGERGGEEGSSKCCISRLAFPPHLVLFGKALGPDQLLDMVLEFLKGNTGELT